jgi:hypothetical protein
VTALLFLSIAVVVSVVGTTFLWLRHRKPTTWDSGINDFAREMKALEPRDQPTTRRVVNPPRDWLDDDEHPLNRR